MDRYIEFGNYQFDGETGELIHTDNNGQQTISRLQPQPTALLNLLISNHPNVVSHDTIKTALWPNVHVDFEGSLHFCIRQIRSALNDDSSNPTFIENIPRRGYRWIPTVKNKSLAEPEAPIQRKQSWLTKKWLFIPLFLGVIVTAVMLVFYLPSENQQE